jgi:teichuronic acid exporter
MLKSYVTSLIETYSSAILNFGLTLLVANIYLPAEIGIFSKTIALLTIGGIIVEGGLQSFVIYKQLKSDQILSLHTISIYLGFLLGLTLTVTGYFIGIEKLGLLTILLVTIIYGYGSISSAMLIKENLYKKLGIVNSIPIIAGIIFFATIKTSKITILIDFLYYQLLISSFLQVVLLWYFSGLTFNLNLNLALLKEGYKYSYKIFIQGLQDKLIINLALILVSKSFPFQAGSLYNANKIQQFTVKKLTLGVSRVLFASFSGKGQSTKVELLHNMLKRISYILPGIYVIAILLIEILFLFFPKEWYESKDYAKLLTIEILILPYVVVIQNYFNSINLVTVSLRINTIKFSILSFCLLASIILTNINILLLGFSLSSITGIFYTLFILRHKKQFSFTLKRNVLRGLFLGTILILIENLFL